MDLFPNSRPRWECSSPLEVVNRPEFQKLRELIKSSTTFLQEIRIRQILEPKSVTVVRLHPTHERDVQLGGEKYVGALRDRLPLGLSENNS